MANSNHDPVIIANVWLTLSSPSSLRGTADSALLHNQELETGYM